MRRIRSALLLLSSVAAPLLGQATPTTGAQVFQRMHDAYAGQWYHTLRFVQKTTQRRPDGSLVIATWYESLRYTPAATQLRIDIGDPHAGNGVLYTADSTWSVRAGHAAGAQGEGNVFLPLIEGVYMQPVSRTIAELANTHVDMSRVATGSWRGRAAWVIGATSATDTTSPQIWVDQSRNVVVRAIVASAAPGTPPFDISLDDYVQVGRGWLATKVTLTSGGVARQIEEYADWKADVDLPDALFSLATWTSAPHWADR